LQLIIVRRSYVAALVWLRNNYNHVLAVGLREKNMT